VFTTDTVGGASPGLCPASRGQEVDIERGLQLQITYFAVFGQASLLWSWRELCWLHGFCRIFVKSYCANDK
jgi:hypothetical protein